MPAPVVSPQFSEVLDHVRWAEGPVFDCYGNFFMVAPAVEKGGKPAGQILKIDLLAKHAEVFCEPNVDGDGGIPAGCQADKLGNLYVTDMRLGLLLVKPDGTFTQVARRDAAGGTMQGCNDCTFDNDGNLWVTAPAGEIAPGPYVMSFEKPFGSVYCLTADGQMLRVDSNFKYCNGIVVKHTADGRPEKLIVAETATRLLWSYDIEGPGKISNRQKWARLPGLQPGPDGTDLEAAATEWSLKDAFGPEYTGCETGPDGMDFDERGNLLVAHRGSGFIEVFGPDGGDPIQRIRCPFAKPSNLQFKPGSTTVLVTEHTNNALWQFEWVCKGMPQFCET